MPDKRTIKIPALLKQLDMAVTEITPEGRIKAKDLDSGQEGFIKVPELLKKVGLNPEEYNVSLNDTKTALQVTPDGIDYDDRLRLSRGNAKGNIAYLKEKFEDVRYDEENGVVVKENGVWKSADPSWMGEGDAWTRTKELMTDISEEALSIGPRAWAGAKGAALGTAVAGPIGGVIGAAAGVGGVSAIESSFGRALGTYEGDNTDIAMEAGLEALITLGMGAAIPVGKKGVEIASKMFKKPTGALEPLVNGVKGAGTEGKNLAQQFAERAGVPPRFADVAFKNAKEVDQLHLKHTGKSLNVAREDFLNTGTNAMMDLAVNARKQLSTVYTQDMGEAIKAAGNHSFNLREGANKTINYLADEAQGILVKEGGKIRPIPRDKFARRFIGEGVPDALLNTSYRKLQQSTARFNNLLSKASKTNLSAMEASELYRQANLLWVDLGQSLNPSRDPRLTRIFQESINPLRNSIKEGFVKASPDAANKFLLANKRFQEGVGAADYWQNIATGSKEDFKQAFRIKLNDYGDIQKTEVADAVNGLVKLYGPKGEQARDTYLKNFAAYHTTDLGNIFGIFKGALPPRALVAVTRWGEDIKDIAVKGARTPIKKGVDIASKAWRKTKTTLQRMTPEQIQKIASTPELSSSILRAAPAAIMENDLTREQLLSEGEDFVKQQ